MSELKFISAISTFRVPIFLRQDPLTQIWEIELHFVESILLNLGFIILLGGRSDENRVVAKPWVSSGLTFIDSWITVLFCFMNIHNS